MADADKDILKGFSLSNKEQNGELKLKDEDAISATFYDS